MFGIHMVYMTTLSSTGPALMPARPGAFSMNRYFESLHSLFRAGVGDLLRFLGSIRPRFKVVVAITIVCRPYHGPCVNVEKAATRARRVETVTNSPRVAADLASLHAVRDSTIISSRNNWQLSKNVAKGNNIHYRIWRGQIEQLRSNLSSRLPPAWLSVTRAISIQRLNECTLAFHN